METAATLPDFIGNYRVLRPIARGGMAEVYEVEDTITGEHFALKVLVQTGGALPRFNREYDRKVLGLSLEDGDNHLHSRKAAQQEVYQLERSLCRLDHAERNVR